MHFRLKPPNKITFWWYRDNDLFCIDDCFFSNTNHLDGFGVDNGTEYHRKNAIEFLHENASLAFSFGFNKKI